MNVHNVINYLNAGTYTIVKSPGVGRCIMHSIITTVNVSNTSSARIDVLSAKLETETLVNYDMYMNFIDAEDRVMALTNGLNDYIVHKQYDTAFGDLVPIIIANALSVNLLIIT